MTKTLATLTNSQTSSKLRVLVVAKVEFDGQEWWYRVCKAIAANHGCTFQVRGDRLVFDK